LAGYITSVKISENARPKVNARVKIKVKNSSITSTLSEKVFENCEER
jgi:hypothetical protein